MTSNERGVALMVCKICGRYWIEEHGNDENWSGIFCCEREGSVIPLEHEYDGNYFNFIWTDAGVVLTWAEEKYETT